MKINYSEFRIDLYQGLFAKVEDELTDEMIKLSVDVFDTIYEEVKSKIIRITDNIL